MSVYTGSIRSSWQKSLADTTNETTMSTSIDNDPTRTLLTNVILPGRGTENIFDVEVDTSSSKIVSIKASAKTSKNSPPSRIIPTLCHPHIHLDKPFLLTAHNDDSDLPDYSDLAPQEGSFAEALSNTSKAKERYTSKDLERRGEQLVIESIQAGVTSMRAFVEVDRVTKHKCVQAGVLLKSKYQKSCHIQLCIFAQDPIISEDKNGPENRKLVDEALEEYSKNINALGSTPYVESSDENQQKNIDWTIQKAIQHKKHVDFHLDYNLDSSSTPMIWYVVEALKKSDWVKNNPSRTVVIGHCTRMTLFSKDEMQKLAKEIHDASLPIHFVGLPTSDLFMMGRPDEGDWGGARPRGTMQVLELIRQFDLKACIGINNVGNAFTPWGSADPLKLASLGVGIYQAGTPKDAELLFECISALAQEAIGLNSLVVRSLEEGAHALFMVITNKANLELASGQRVEARKWLSVADMVWDPPEISRRRVVGTVFV